jgi:hypothetical protein
MYTNACAARDEAGEGDYISVSGVDVGALGEELVDEVELAFTRRRVERGHAAPRWGGGENRVG